MADNYSLFFIRHGKLLLPFKDHSEMPFKILTDLASENLNPPIDKKFNLELIKQQISKVIPFEKLDRIYTSPSRRCQETTFLITDFIFQNFQEKLRPIILPELREIHFDLNKIVNLSSQIRLDIEEINNCVFKAMVNGKNCEPVLESYQRVKIIFAKLNKNNKTKKSLFVTHDFFMRVIEIYIKNRGRDKSQITYNDLKNTKRNLYLHGFATNFKLSSFFPF